MTTATATAKKVPATAKRAPGARTTPAPPAASATPPAFRRRGVTPLTPMRAAAAKSMRKLAAHVQESHPDMTVHEHLRDAAKVLESGNEEGAQRHLRAAMFALTPQSLMRNGLHTDDDHAAARQVMHGAHRHLLLVKDIADVNAKNQQQLRRDSGDGQAVPSPRPATQADPNAGYGPGALAQKPTVRQPPGDKALNAPNRADGGGSDPAVADPVGPQPRGSKQFAYGWDDLAAVIELVNGRPKVLDLTGDGRGHHIPGSPMEYEHGYIPLTPAAAASHFKGNVPKSWHAPSGGGKAAAAGSSPEAAAARKAAENVRLERGLTKGQKEEAEQRLYKAANHLDAGNHGEAAAELDAAMHATSLHSGGIIKGSTAAQARDLRDKVNGGKPAPKGILTGSHPADKLTASASPGVTAKGMDTADLKAADAELSRRAALLGKPGQLSKAHKAVQAEMKSRGIAMSVTWDDLAAVVELARRPNIVDLVGPHGYIHGWIFVGIPGPGQEVYHPQHGRGTVTASGSGRVQVSFDTGHSKTFPVRSDQSRGHFEQMTDDELATEYNRSSGSRASAVTDELDRRDQADADAKASRVSALYAEKPKAEADRNRVYRSLVNEGENPQDAWSHAHGTNSEAMQKQSVIADLRAQGYKGAGFDALTRDAFKDEVRRRTISAEGATNGYMLSPAGRKAGIDPWGLHTGPESRARKYASPELKEWWDQNGRPTVADFQAQLMGQKAGMKPADFYASVTWDELSAVIELSAQTPALATVPHPFGKPGGPGLWHQKGMELPPYVQNVAHALLRTGRAKDLGEAIAMARAATERWKRGKNTRPEVRAAATASDAQWRADQARAHAHSVTWDDVTRALEFAVTPTTAGGGAAASTSQAGTTQPRVPAGSMAGGQFAKAGSSGTATPDAHQQHLAHVAHTATAAGKTAQQKQGLLASAASDRAQAGKLIAQRKMLQAALASASGKTSSGQAGSTTSAGSSTTASSAPAAASTTAKTSTAAASTASTPAGTSTSSAATPSAAQLTSQIAALTTQINGLLTAAAQATAQAAKL